VVVINEVSIVEVEAQTVLSIRKRGKYEEILMMFAAVFPFAIENGLQIQGPPLFLTREMSEEEALATDEKRSRASERAVGFPGYTRMPLELRAGRQQGNRVVVS